jgi:phage terminase large subunit GpA-like protein
MDAVSDPLILEIWVMKSAQIGWTEILNNVIGYFIDQDASPILLVQPTLDLAEAWSKDRFAPMLRDTECLRLKVADPKARDSGNTLLHKKFTGGHLTVAGANSPAGLASRPIRIFLCDEVDRFPSSAGTEGDPYSLGKKRTTTFWNRKILAGSTPTVKGSSRIEAGFDESDQRFYFVPCPHCNEFQRLIWAQVKWDDEPAKAWYTCQHCAAVLTDSDKATMLRTGEWRATKPSKGIAGFHISEIYSPWVTWGEMAVAFLAAKKFPETLQTWINTALGETWEDKGETLETKGLAARMEAYTAEQLPPGVLLLTAGTDVQDDRLETTVWGWGTDEECWRVEHIVLRGNPGSKALWLEHDAILRRRWKTDDGRELLIEAAAVDSGGHFTEHVYRYCSERKRFRVFAIKGQGGPGRLIWPKKASRSSKSRVSLWMIGVDTAKELLYGRLKKVTEPGPGYVHFDADTTAEFLEQLTSETVVFRQVQGRKVRLWKPKKANVRQEALDCLVYAYAAMIGRGGPRVLIGRHAKPIAQVTQEEVGPTHDTTEEVVEEPEPVAPRPVVRRIRQQRRGWAKSW